LETRAIQSAGQAVSARQLEGRVKFRIVAPKAKSGGVSFRDRSAFTKGEDDAWIGYTRPLDEGFHYCIINIDGAEVPDPKSMFFYGASRWGSAVEVPAKDCDFLSASDCSAWPAPRSLLLLEVGQHQPPRLYLDKFLLGKKDVNTDILRSKYTDVDRAKRIPWTTHELK